MPRVAKHRNIISIQNLWNILITWLVTLCKYELLVRAGFRPPIIDGDNKREPARERRCIGDDSRLVGACSALNTDAESVEARFARDELLELIRADTVTTHSDERPNDTET